MNCTSAMERTEYAYLPPYFIFESTPLPVVAPAITMEGFLYLHPQELYSNLSIRYPIIFAAVPILLGSTRFTLIGMMFGKYSQSHLGDCASVPLPVAGLLLQAAMKTHRRMGP